MATRLYHATCPDGKVFADAEATALLGRHEGWSDRHVPPPVHVGEPDPPADETTRKPAASVPLRLAKPPVVAPPPRPAIVDDPFA